MRLERGGSNGPGEQDITNALRAIYAAPEGDAYWDSLESRILARVTDGGGEGWSFLDRWVGAGLAAAGLVAALLGVATMRARTAEAQDAFEAELEAPSGVPLAAQARSAASDANGREATLRYVISR